MMAMKRWIVLPIIILSAAVFVVTLSTVASASTGYSYYQAHTITGSPDGALSYFPMRYMVYNTTGNSTGNTIFLGGHSRNWPYDVAFYDSTNSTMYPCWLEWNNSTAAAYWVNITSIPASPSTTTMYVWYGNASATNPSNGTATFLLFDDFNGTSLDTTKWQTFGGTTASVANGLLNVTYTSTSGGVGSISYWGPYGVAGLRRVNITSNTVQLQGDFADGNCTQIRYTATDQQVEYFNYNISTWTTYQVNGIDKTQFHTLYTEWCNATLSRFSVDYSNTYNMTTNVPSYQEKYVPLNLYGSASAYCDWAAVMKTTPNKPVDGAWTVEGSENLLANPGFESGATGWVLDATGTNTGCNTTVNDSSTAHSGNYYANLSMWTYTNGSRSITSQAVNVTPSSMVNVSLWYRGSINTSGNGGYVKLQCYNGATWLGTNTWNWTDLNNYSPFSSTWKFWYNNTYMLPSSCDNVKLSFTLETQSSPGYNILLDDVSLRYKTYVFSPPVANFTMNVSSGMAPLAVMFNDTSTGNPTSWNWSFGDGSPNATTQNATHVYTSPGIYTVVLTVANADGNSSTSRQVVAIIYSGCQRHTITGSPDGALSYYQMRYVVYNTTGTSFGNTIFLNGGSKNWPYDIAFYDSSNVTAYPYYREWYNGTAATFWVNVTSIPAYPSTTVLNVWYGNASATDQSNGTATFLLFDDFNDSSLGSQWETFGGASVSESGGYLNVSYSGSPGGVHSIAYFGPYGVGARRMVKASSNTVDVLGDFGMYIYTLVEYTANSGEVKYRNYNGSTTYGTNVTISGVDKTQWHVLTTEWVNQSLSRFSIDDSNAASLTAEVPNASLKFFPLYVYDSGYALCDYAFVYRVTANPPSDGTWVFLPAYSYCQSHTITGSPDGALSYYQMRYVVYNTTGASFGNTIFLNGGSKNWPYDIAFYDSSNVTAYPYYREWYNGTAATFWVNVTSIPAYPSTTVLNVWYGNASATDRSNGTATFLLFDDFNDSSLGSQWQAFGGASVSESGGYLNVSYSGSPGGVRSIAYFGPYGVGARRMVKASGDTVHVQGDFTGSICTQVRYTTNSGEVTYWNYNGSSIPGVSYINTGVDKTQWHVLTTEWVNRSLSRFSIDDSNVASLTAEVPDTSLKFHPLYVYNSGYALCDYAFVYRVTANPPSDGAWGGSGVFLPAYSYRQGHVVTGSPDGALSYYPLKFTVYNTTGMSTGNTIFLNGHSRNWPYDIAFYDSSNVTAYPYYREWYNGTAATFWVNVTSIPAYPSTTVVNVWYGNASATDRSNGTATFLLFDDFNDGSLGSQWQTFDGVIVTESGGYLNVSYSSSPGGVCSSASFGPYGVGARRMVKASGDTVHVQGDFTGSICTQVRYTTNSGEVTYWNYNGSSIPGVSYINTGVDKTQWHVLTTEWVNRSLSRFSIDDSNVASLTAEVPDTSLKFHPLYVYNSGYALCDYAFVYRVTANQPVHGGYDGDLPAVVAPVASFTMNKTSGTAPLMVGFNDTSSNGPTSWNWSFGDGSPNATTQNATHVYTSPGTYIVTLTVSNVAGSNSTSRVVSVTTSQMLFYDLFTNISSYWSVRSGTWDSSFAYTIFLPANVWSDGTNAVLRSYVTNSTGSEIRSRDMIQYGTYTVSARVVQTTGTYVAPIWSYFWGNSTWQHGEIDFELIKESNGNTTCMMTTWVNYQRNYHTITLWFDPSIGYHTYQYRWKNDSVDFYIDGQYVWTSTTYIPTWPLYFYAQNWVVKNKPSDYGDGVNTLYIDWMTVETGEGSQTNPEPLTSIKYSYYQGYNITGSPDGALSYYPLKFTVYNTTGMSTGNTIFLNGHSRNWPYDIAFYDGGNVTAYPYYREWYNGTAATFWVNVTSIPAYPSNSSMYVWYGNASATDQSNGTATFLLFDDFNDSSLGSQWETFGGASVSESGGYLNVSYSGSPGGVRSTAYFGPYGVGARRMVKASSNIVHVQGDFANGNCTQIRYTTNYGEVLYWNYNGSTVSGANVTIPDVEKTQWHVLTTEWVNQSLSRFSIDDSSAASLTAEVPSSPLKFNALYVYTTGYALCDYLFVFKTTAKQPVSTCTIGETHIPTPTPSPSPSPSPTPSPYGVVVANFVVSATSGVAPLTVYITDYSINATSWAWDFDGDGVVDSYVQNPSHVYSYSGVYNLTLKASNPSYSDVKVVQIFVSAPTPTPTPIPTYDSAYVSNTIPSTMFNGSVATVSVTFVNTGNITWNKSVVSLFCVDGVNGDAYAFTRALSIPLPVDSVAHGGSVVFTFNVSPPATGMYVLAYRMGTNSTLFGDMCIVNVLVSPSTVSPTLTVIPTPKPVWPTPKVSYVPAPSTGDGRKLYNTTNESVSAMSGDSYEAFVSSWLNNGSMKNWSLDNVVGQVFSPVTSSSSLGSYFYLVLGLIVLIPVLFMGGLGIVAIFLLLVGGGLLYMLPVDFSYKIVLGIAIVITAIIYSLFRSRYRD